MNYKRVIFVRIEPTTYTLALLRALREIWPGEIDAYFISANATQAWNFDEQKVGARLLPSQTAAAKSAVRKMITESPPALVHTAGWGAQACWAAISSAYSMHVPVVVDHDTWQDAATGIKRLAKRVLLPIMLRKISHFAPGGQRQAGFVRRYGVPEAQITPINMTVDVSAIRRHLIATPNARALFRRRFSLSESSRVVLFMARLVAGKGVDDMMEAWQALVADAPDVHLLIVGDGPMKSQLESGGYERVRILGRLSGEDVWNAYAAADVFVAPSHREGWGLTINEAMAAGLPIVMTDAFGCIGDLAFPDETACIVPKADANRLREGLEKVLSDSVYRNHLRDNAEKLISNWTIEGEAEKIVSIWKMLLEDETIAE